MMMIDEVARLCGLSGRYGRHDACPFHAEATPGAFCLYRDDRGGHFFCHGCGAHGDGVELYRRLMGVSLGDALRVVKGGDSPKVRRPPVVRTYTQREAARMAAIREESRLLDDLRAADRLCARAENWDAAFEAETIRESIRARLRDLQEE